MWSHYTLNMLRSFSRHKLYTAINIFGLALGIAVFLILALIVRFELSFERWIPQADKIYVVRTHGPDGWTPSTMGGLLQQLRADYPQVVGVRMRSGGVVVQKDGNSTSEMLTEVDPAFLNLFNLPFEQGDRGSALKSPDQIALT